MKGQIVAFVDIPGCGKSTMFAMLECFYDPGRGHLALDGKGLDEMNPWEFREEVSPVQQEPKLHPGTVREKVSPVQQEPKLHPGTVRENIAMGVLGEEISSIREGDISQSCPPANAWNLICSVPEGLNTACGANGL